MKLKASVALLIASCAAGGVHAEDGFPPVTISGFGTLALTRSNTDDAEFSRPNQLKGATTQARNGVDSNLGIQATAKFNDWLSTTGQMLIRKDNTDQFTADLSLAFIKIKASDDMHFRVGRLGIPIYMISDYRNISYANTMIRPPIEMYTQVSVDYMEGADVIYQQSINDISVTAQFGVGKIDYNNSLGFVAEFRDITSLNLVAEKGPFTLRFGRSATKFSVPGNAQLNALTAGLEQFGFSSAAKQLIVKDSSGTFTSIGLGLDWQNIVAQAEYGKRKVDVLSFPSTTSWYTMVGYRFGKVLPYFNHASAKQDSARTVAGVPTTGPLAALGLGANAVASSSPIQTSNSLGVRWDFHRSAAFKAQIDRFSPKDGPGTFINAKPSFKGLVTVFAAGIDFVF
jgi:hypothetical protein